jgi:hypothetical protein
MSIFLKITNRCGYPIFVALSFVTLPLWFPILWAWIVIDPPYRWAMWRKRHLNPSINPKRRVSEVSLIKDYNTSTGLNLERNVPSFRAYMPRNKKP